MFVAVWAFGVNVVSPYFSSTALCNGPEEDTC